jgi:hypothetical protein
VWVGVGNCQCGPAGSAAGTRARCLHSPVYVACLHPCGWHVLSCHSKMGGRGVHRMHRISRAGVQVITCHMMTTRGQPERPYALQYDHPCCANAPAVGKSQTQWRTVGGRGLYSERDLHGEGEHLGLRQFPIEFPLSHTNSTFSTNTMTRARNAHDTPLPTVAE